MGIGERPILDFDKLLGDLDIIVKDPRDTNLFRTAVCAPSRGHASILRSASDPRMQTNHGNRFAIAAAVGRLFWAAAGHARTVAPICAAHGDYSRYSETRRANAFAAELLLPMQTLRKALGEKATADQVATLAEDYGMSRAAARWHAHNAHIEINQ